MNHRFGSGLIKQKVVNIGRGFAESWVEPDHSSKPNLPTQTHQTEPTELNQPINQPTKIHKTNQTNPTNKKNNPNKLQQMNQKIN